MEKNKIESKTIVSNQTKKVCNNDWVCIKVNDILLTKDWKRYLYEFKLPTNIDKRLKFFLYNTKMLDNKIIKDCNSFVSYLHELPLNNRKAIFEKFNKSNFKNEQDLNPWDIILIENRNNWWVQWLYHYAMYIWNNKYISKLSNWIVWITELKEMMWLYEWTNITCFKK